VLYGASGRLTSDRRPPGATNTLNIPEGFTRAVTLLVSDGCGNAAHVAGVLAQADGPATTVWKEFQRLGTADIQIDADTEFGGLAVIANTPGDWVCRMIGAPE
jgi:hypothetical protein